MRRQPLPHARVACLTALAAVAMAAAACQTSAETTGDAPRELTVSAAASLTESFTAIGAAFEAEHPGVAVRFNFGPSSGLATQIQAGAPVDVFASADARWMDAVAADPGVTERGDFASNSLVILVPAANPAAIRSADDLARPGVRLVLAAEGVPVGDYARQALAAAGVADGALANVVSNEEDVKGVVQRVVLGEADAGIAYRTDLTPAVVPSVRAVDLPAGANVRAVYPIAGVAGAPQPDLARQFVAFVRGEAGQAILRAAGFESPD